MVSGEDASADFGGGTGGVCVCGLESDYSPTPLRNSAPQVATVILLRLEL